MEFQLNNRPPWFWTRLVECRAENVQTVYPFKKPDATSLISSIVPQRGSSENTGEGCVDDRNQQAESPALTITKYARCQDSKAQYRGITNKKEEKFQL